MNIDRNIGFYYPPFRILEGRNAKWQKRFSFPKGVTEEYVLERSRIGRTKVTFEDSKGKIRTEMRWFNLYTVKLNEEKFQAYIIANYEPSNKAANFRLLNDVIHPLKVITDGDIKKR